MMVNPFEDPDAEYKVLINDEGQHSLWPLFADVPEGWDVAFGPDARQACLDFIEESWRDMRPRSLVAAMAQSQQAEQNGGGQASA